MFKIMFVCMGNVCRSPLAQILLENYLKNHGLSDFMGVESSGVNVFNKGQRACEQIRTVAAERGVPFDHYSRSFVPSDAREYDLILAMDEETMFRLKKMTRHTACKGSIRFFRDFDPVKDNSREVPDPWSGNLKLAEHVYTMIERTLNPLVELAGVKR